MFRIGFIGGGPATLYVLDQLLLADVSDFELFVFEKSGQIGVGMPYTNAQVADEHLVHILCEETPELNGLPILEWLHSLPETKRQSMGIPTEFAKDMCTYMRVPM